MGFLAPPQRNHPSPPLPQPWPVWGEPWGWKEARGQLGAAHCTWGEVILASPPRASHPRPSGWTGGAIPRKHREGSLRGGGLLVDQPGAR